MPNFKLKDIELHLRDAMDLLHSLDDASVDLLLTDPPYGILDHKIETGVDIPAFFAEIKRVVKPQGFVVFFGQQPTLTTWNYHALQLFKWKAEIIWYKKSATSFLNDMTRWYENISVLINGTDSRRFNAVNRPFIEVKQSLAEFSESATVLQAVSELIKALKSEENIQKVIQRLELDKAIFTQNGKRNDDVHLNQRKQSERWLDAVSTCIKGVKPQNFVSFDYTDADSFVLCFTPHNRIGFNKAEFNLKHPSIKPVALIEWLILLCSKEGDLILDPFMGTGTTAIAAYNTARRFIGCEIFPEYYDISVHRLEMAQYQQTQQQGLF